MSDVDPVLVAAVRNQLASLPPDVARIGWKVGAGDAERIGDEPIAVGYLTEASLLEQGSTYHGGGELRVDVEVALELGGGGNVVGYAAALEVCDFANAGPPPRVVAENVFHRAVAFGPFVPALPAELEAALFVNGERRCARPVDSDPVGRVAQVDRVLQAIGERFEPGDRLITGSILQAPVEPGDAVVADLGALGRVGIEVAG